jgi:hypothetical protein
VWDKVSTAMLMRQGVFEAHITTAYGILGMLLTCFSSFAAAITFY